MGKKTIFKNLAEGQIPEEIVIIEWEDITQYEHCKLEDNAELIRFHSTGVVVNVSNGKLDLQQTWCHDDKEPTSVPSNPSNLRLSLPKGVIKRVYKFKLVKED